MSKYYASKEIHDSQMFEIMANLYGVENSLNFLKNSNIDCSEKEIIELEKQYKLFQQQYENYNLTERLNLIIKDYCKYVNNSNFDKTIFKLFLNDDGSIKDINSIFSNDVVLKLDPKILLAFIKADSIKKMISETSLSERTSNILNELLSKGSINSLQDQKTTKSFNI